MSLTPSTMLNLGTDAPDFNLKDLDNNTITLNNFSNYKALLVVFMCNHCPYVLHVIDSFSKIAAEYQSKGVATVGINSNDIETYPQDAPDKMIEFSKNHNLSFPYLLDDTQKTAQSYRASCTPDFFLFDNNRKLVYRGQMDEARPGNNKPVTGQNIREAMDAVLSSKAVTENQKPSMGCNIKWKEGNEPDYF